MSAYSYPGSDNKYTARSQHNTVSNGGGAQLEARLGDDSSLDSPTFAVDAGMDEHPWSVDVMGARERG